MTEKEDPLRFRFCAGDISGAGEAVDSLKQALMLCGIGKETVRRVCVCAYEALVNAAIYAGGGSLVAEAGTELIRLSVSDNGPGIKDIANAFIPGRSTASPEALAQGFGGGSGLTNMKRSSDEMYVKTEPGGGTEITMLFKL